MNKLLFFILLIFFNNYLISQSRITFNGQVLDKDNLEPISFAPAQFSNSFIGKISDVNGNFNLSIPDTTTLDTLKISYVGYEPFVFVYRKGDTNVSTKNFRILLEKAIIKKEIIIKSKYTKAYLLWRKIVKKKDKNDYDKFNSYSYNLHNRIEIDINDVNVKKLDSNFLFQKFKFILKNTDSSEFGKVVLPFYITETLSDIFLQKDPYKKREVISGILSSGIKNESILQLLGGSYQNINFYNNQISFFNKELISPFANNADNFYNYKILDTQYLNGQRLIHFLFIPKTYADNTFDGDCWVRDTLFAIQKINLRLSKDANINFVNKANFMEEFQLINDSTYFLKKVSFVAEISPTEKSKLNFLIRKNATYKNISTNKDSISKEVIKNVATEEVVILDSAKEKEKDFWNINRHEQLSKSELMAHNTIDTLWKMPVFLRIINTVKFLQSGYLDFGKFRIGKWWSIFGRNPFNGPRLRLELSNNELLSKKFNFKTNLTINSFQQKINGGIQLKYIFNNKWWSELSFLYSNNIDLGSYNNKPSLFSADNVFVNLARRRNIYFRIHNLEQYYISFEKKFPTGFGFNLEAQHQLITPIVRNIVQNFNNRNIDPNIINNKFIVENYNKIINTAFSLGLNYSHLEKWINIDFEQISLGSKYPILSLVYTKGIPSILESKFDYDKLIFNLKQTIKREPWGIFKLNLELGKIWGTVPYIILERPYANLTMYYLTNYFNTVKPFEFITDQYAKLHFEHNLGLGLLRFIPYINKLKIRQIWMLNAMYGSISNSNLNLNNNNYIINSNSKYLDLINKPLVEIGTGIDNIFSILRISYFWRLSPYENNLETIMFSFHIQF